ncbi:MAG: TatD family hydrolase [Pseudomonadales bacterium]|nr:TatD family hydrolase [Pseudomonadales bacterium]
MSVDTVIDALVDTHCHLDFPLFDADRAVILEQCQQAGVTKIVVPGVTANAWDNLAQVCQQYPGVLYPSFGLHPCFMSEHREGQLRRLGEYCDKHNAVAVGEIGLDFFIENPRESDQMALFKSQVLVAKDLNLAVLIHCRKAHDQCLKLLKDNGFQNGGIIHAFSGSLEQAKRYVDFGFKLGIGGGATYDRAKKLHRIIRELPLSSFVLETDAPDIPPSFARDEPNSPVRLPNIAETISQHVNISISDLVATTSENAHKILNL